jgi:hypothetical protein
MADIRALGTPRRGGISDTYDIDTMCEEGLIASLTGKRKIAAGGTSPFAVTAGRKGKKITGYVTGEEVLVQLDAGVSSVTIGATVYVVAATGKATTTEGTSPANPATQLRFVSTEIADKGRVQNIVGSEANTRKCVLCSFVGGV